MSRIVIKVNPSSRWKRRELPPPWRKEKWKTNGKKKSEVEKNGKNLKRKSIRDKRDR